MSTESECPYCDGVNTMTEHLENMCDCYCHHPEKITDNPYYKKEMEKHFLYIVEKTVKLQIYSLVYGQEEEFLTEWASICKEKGVSHTINEIEDMVGDVLDELFSVKRHLNCVPI